MSDQGRSPASEPSALGAPFRADSFDGAVSAITSAFGDPTRRSIYLYVHANNGVTASSVAAEFDLHANVARHHLDKLAAGGYVDVTVERADGAGAGRPSKRYRITSEEFSLDFTLRRDDLLIALLARALDMLPDDAAEQMAEDVGKEYGRAMAAAMAPGDPHKSFRNALHAVAESLTAHGFGAHAEADGNELRIVADLCPFGEAAVEHPVICAVDRGMVKGMLGALYGETEPGLASSRPQGDDVCVTSF